MAWSFGGGLLLTRALGRLGNAPRFAAGIFGGRFNGRGRKWLRGVGQQLRRIVGDRLVRIDDRVRLREWLNHALSQPACLPSRIASSDLAVRRTDAGPRFVRVMDRPTAVALKGVKLRAGGRLSPERGSAGCPSPPRRRRSASGSAEGLGEFTHRRVEHEMSDRRGWCNPCFA